MNKTEKCKERREEKYGELPRDGQTRRGAELAGILCTEFVPCAKGQMTMVLRLVDPREPSSIALFSLSQHCSGEKREGKDKSH